MNRQKFGKLYVNANSFADLAMKQEFAGMEKLLSGMASMPETTPEEPSEADLDALFKNLDLSALDGLDVPDLFAVEVDTPSQAVPETPAVIEELQEPITDISEVKGADGKMDAGIIDVESYFESAYGSEAEIADRIDRAYRKADLNQLQNLVDNLPGDSSEITSQLSGEQMNSWLERYKANESELSQLVVEIRQLDINF